MDDATDAAEHSSGRPGGGRTRRHRRTRMGAAGAGAGRDRGAVPRLPRELQRQPGTRSPAVRLADARPRSRRPRISSSPPSTTAIPVLDPATFKLQVTGLVDTPKAFSLDDLKKMPKGEVMFGFECSGNRAPLQGLCQQRQVDRRAAGGAAQERRRQGRGARVRLPRRRPRRRRSRVAHPEVQPRPAVRPQHAAREGAVARAAAGLRLQRRAADPPPGLPAAPDRAGLVRRRQRQVAVATSSSSRTRTWASTRRAGTAPCAAR